MSTCVCRHTVRMFLHVQFFICRAVIHLIIWYVMMQRESKIWIEKSSPHLNWDFVLHTWKRWWCFTKSLGQFMATIHCYEQFLYNLRRPACWEMSKALAAIVCMLFAFVFPCVCACAHTHSNDLASVPTIVLFSFLSKEPCSEVSYMLLRNG